MSKQLKAKQAELDTSVTAQNALKSDLDKLAAEYTQATRHNARNAGRKPKLTADQEQEIKNLRSEGLNVRQIAAKWKKYIDKISGQAKQGQYII